MKRYELMHAYLPIKKTSKPLDIKTILEEILLHNKKIADTQMP
ncbi:hypothetical protein [Treponema phagedenis]|nr:hypothetical protein [Treponema phagedenis]